MLSEHFSDPAFDPVAQDGSADLAANDDAESRKFLGRFLARVMQRQAPPSDPASVFKDPSKIPLQS